MRFANSKKMFVIDRNKKRNIAFFSLSFVLVLLYLLCGCLTLSGSYEYRIDKFINSLEHFNDVSILGKSDSLMLSLNERGTQNDKQYVFNDALYYFSYDNHVSAVRCVVDNAFLFNGQRIHIETQKNFYIQKVKSNGIEFNYMDYGLYSTYFLDTELVNRDFSGCDGFLYISDTFADKLIKKYNINQSVSIQEQYKTLVMDEQYGKIAIDYDDSSIIFRIVNVVRTDIRNGPRTKELYGDFGLTYINNELKARNFDFSIEFDLKNNQACIKKTIQYLNSFGYNTSNTDFSFKRKNQLGTYENIDEKNAAFEKLSNGTLNDAWIAALYIIISIAFFAGLFGIIILYKNKIGHISIKLFIVCCTSFVVFGFISCFVYIFPYFSVAPIAAVVTTGIYAFKDLSDVFNRKNR